VDKIKEKRITETSQKFEDIIKTFVRKMPLMFDFWYFVEEEEEEYDRRNKA